ncbi:caspase [Fusarium subglutinans]|uniref:Caspase n=1 Tax=Gibberella subglutinans TaxID=42677 RepID=A0A8H5KVU1_GIBSU|nr:caspase [Fusarium subglutinans]KAF5580827.1 caspase [Fusarium subglutinans]
MSFASPSTGTHKHNILPSRSEILMNSSSFRGRNDSVIERAQDEPQPGYCCGCTSMINRVPIISKAVIVCIHYFNTRGQLRSHNASGIAAFLQQVYGCPPENIIILSDMYFRPTSQPTKRAILQSIHWLFSGSVPGDRLFFYSSVRSQSQAGSTTGISDMTADDGQADDLHSVMATVLHSPLWKDDVYKVVTFPSPQPRCCE